MFVFRYFGTLVDIWTVEKGSPLKRNNKKHMQDHETRTTWTIWSHSYEIKYHFGIESKASPKHQTNTISGNTVHHTQSWNSWLPGRNALSRSFPKKTKIGNVYLNKWLFSCSFPKNTKKKQRFEQTQPTATCPTAQVGPSVWNLLFFCFFGKTQWNHQFLGGRHTTLCFFWKTADSTVQVGPSVWNLCFF